MSASYFTTSMSHISRLSWSNSDGFWEVCPFGECSLAESLYGRIKVKYMPPISESVRVEDLGIAEELGERRMGEEQFLDEWSDL